MGRTFTASQARTVGQSIGVDFTQTDLEQFRIGLSVELEHGKENAKTNVTDDDLQKTGKIAWAHLNEIPNYYSRLTRMERAAGIHEPDEP